MTRNILVLLLLVSLLPSCGSDKNVCEKAFDVQKEMCSHNKTCILCPCVLQNYFCTFNFDRMNYIHVGPLRIPDFSGSGVFCEKPSLCNDDMKQFAESCLENQDEAICTPWIYLSAQRIYIYLCAEVVNLGLEPISCE